MRRGGAQLLQAIFHQQLLFLQPDALDLFVRGQRQVPVQIRQPPLQLLVPFFQPRSFMLGRVVRHLLKA